MKKIPKQEYAPEFRELAAKQVKAGQSIGAVACELGLVEQTLRNLPCDTFGEFQLSGKGLRPGRYNRSLTYAPTP